MDYKKTGSVLYEGKAKRIFALENHPECIYMEFKDSLTAFDAVKKGSFAGKGKINRNVASLIFRYLKKQGVAVHWIQDVCDDGMIAKKVEIIPLEVVVRNVLAGSTAKKFAIQDGTPLKKPLVEFFYKNDALHDPFLSDDQALMLEVVTESEIVTLKERARKVNQAMVPFFEKIGLRLVDFKIEFGRTPNGEILLSDEITADSCRLWDLKTGEKMDKDRFRWDMGRVEESYQEVFERMNQIWGKEVL